MRLDIIRDEADFLALQPWWDALLEQSATPTPFLRWDWVRLWWEIFHEGFQLAIAVLRDAQQRPLAIAPLMIGAEPAGMRRHLQHIGFLAGLGEVKGERMDFLVPRGREAELTPLLCQVFPLLAAEWQAVRLNKLPEDSPNKLWIVRALNECTTGASVLLRTQCFCLSLTPDWPAFTRSMKSKPRREVARRLAALQSEYDFKEVLVTAADAESRLEEFAALHRHHYPENVSSFLAPAAWRFHRQLALKWITTGRAMIPCLTIGGEMVGGVYGFIEGDEFFYYQSGWHPQYARFSMGRLSFRWAVESCILKGLRLFDMLPGSYRYKREWAHTSRYVLDLEAYQPESLRATLFRSVRHLKRLLPGHTPSLITA